MESETRVLPHDLAAEKAILGAILVHSPALDQVQSFLHPEDFFRVAHREIFSSMLRVSDRRSDIDPLTLMDDLKREGWAEEVGGPAYIANLTDGVPRSANVMHYAEIVKDHARRRALIFAANEILQQAYDGSSRAEDIILSADKAIIGMQGRATGRTVDLRESFGDLVSDIEFRTNNRGKLIGLTSGFQSIDDVTSGWQPGDMIVVAARPSIGKTAFVLNSVEAVAASGTGALIVSLEMRRRQLEYRRLSSLSQVPLTRILNGWLGEVDFERIGPATGAIGERPIYVDDRASQTVTEIRATARRLRAEKKIGLVVVDYVQLVGGNVGRRGATRNEELSDISRRLKVLADEISCPVIVLSQLSRAGESRADKRPILSDLRETGALEQDADTVCFLHRENHRESGVTSFIIEKQRNGPTGTLNLSLNRETQTFLDVGPEPEAPKQESLAEDLERKKKPRRSRSERW